MSDVYYIQAHPGGGHHFLLSLLRHIYLQKDTCIEFNGTGNSHLDAFEYLVQTTEPMLQRNFPREEWPYRWKLIDPFSPEPLIILQQSVLTQKVDFDRLNAMHPSIKYLFVNVYPEDFTLLETNHVLKHHRFADPKAVYVKGYMDLYSSLKFNDSRLRKNITRFVDFNVSELEILIKHKVAMPDSIKIFDALVQSCVPPAAIQDRLYVIDYTDILYNKEKTISTIEAMTGKIRTPAADASYDMYLQHHHALFASDAPWFTPKY